MHAPHDHVHAPISASERTALLARADARCAEAGESLTPLRRRVLELLIEAPGPAKAYDLLDGLRSMDGARAKPPTIYRALEFLTRLGLVHRVESLNAFVACDRGACARTAVFLICDCCGCAEEMDAGRVLVDLDDSARRAGFSIERTMIEIHGRCAACSRRP